MIERRPDVQVVVVATVEDDQRAIYSHVTCVLCERQPDDDELIIRIRDFAADGHETVMHKNCVLALLALTDDDVVVDDRFRAVLYAHVDN